MNILRLKAPIHKAIAEKAWDYILVSISGGKDSGALLAWAIANFPKEKLIAVHAMIDIDWKETLAVVKAQAAHYGVELRLVRAVDIEGKEKGFLDQLTAPRRNRKTGEIGEYQFPDQGNRWCTSILKTGPIDKLARSFKGNVLVLIGERREESSNRAKLEAVRPDVKNTTKKRTVVKYSPILELLETEVLSLTKAQSIPLHPCYALGLKRASCAICIFSSKKDIAIAAKHEPELVAKYIAAEAKIKHSFKYTAATKTKPAKRQSILDILEDQGIDIETLIGLTGLKKGA